MKVFLLSFLFLSSLALASQPANKGPFSDRDALLRAILDAGFPHVFEFKVDNSSFNVAQEKVNSRQEVVVHRQSMEKYLQETSEWERVPSLDYLVQSGMLGSINIGGVKLGTKRYEAFKVGGFAICHRLEEGHAFKSLESFNGGRFHSCITVAMDVNEVIERLELRGSLD